MCSLLAFTSGFAASVYLLHCIQVSGDLFSASIAILFILVYWCYLAVGAKIDGEGCLVLVIGRKIRYVHGRNSFQGCCTTESPLLRNLPGLTAGFSVG